MRANHMNRSTRQRKGAKHKTSMALRQDRLGQTQRIARLIEWLKSPNGGEEAAFALIACGRPAVPALRHLLYERVLPQGTEPRCRAAKTLAAIGAKETLVGFLRAWHGSADLTGSAEEQAVVNEAARALAGLRTEEFYQLLIHLAHRCPLPGVVEALGHFPRDETIPILISALEGDASRTAAEGALRRLAGTASQALASTALTLAFSDDRESASSLRRRRSALELLNDTGTGHRHWRDLRPLIKDRDPMVAFLASKLILAAGGPSEKATAVDRMIALTADSDWFLAGEIEDHLVAKSFAAPDVMSRVSAILSKLSKEGGHEERLSQTLKRIRERVHNGK